MNGLARIRNAAAVGVMVRTRFGLYLSGNGLSLTGTWMQRIACSWLVWDWTGSAFWVGLLAACDLLPVILVSPLAGVAADRWDRLRLNRVAQVISAGNALLLAALLAAGQLGLGGVLLLTLVQGVLTAGTQAARFAMVQQMVPRRYVGAAVGLNATCVNIARLLGPAAAATIILHGGIVWVFALNAVSSVLFFWLLTRIRLVAVPRKEQPPAFLAQMIEGFAHILHRPDLRLVLLTLFAGGALARSIMELMPVVAAQAFDDAITGLAMLTGAAAIGAIGSGLATGHKAIPALLRSLPAWWGIGAVAALVLTRAETPLPGLLAATGLGIAITRGLVASQTYIQLTTPGALRGRALSVFGLIARGSPAIGALGIGYAADLAGLPQAGLYAACGLFALLVLIGPALLRTARTVPEAEV